jgi:hypothetical protein
METVMEVPCPKNSNNIHILLHLPRMRDIAMWTLLVLLRDWVLQSLVLVLLPH